MENLFTLSLSCANIEARDIPSEGETEMPKSGNKERSMALYESILQLNSLEECCAFFDDLCTVGELRAMEQRYDVALLLDQGLVYTDILEKTGASSATISRVNRVFSFGSGGFREMIERRKEKQR